MAMVHLPRLLLFAPKYFKRRVIGICESYGNQKYFSILPFLNRESSINSKDCDNYLKSTESSVTELKEKLESKPYNVKKPKLETIRIHQFENISNISEQELFKTFHKMCLIYFRNREKESFLLELDNLKRSEAFKNFCRIVNNKLTFLSPKTLSIFCNLEYFGVPVTSPLLRKVFTLLLDNINSFSPLDIMDLYLRISKKTLEDVKECQDIKKACELYFEKVLEDALDHVKPTSLLFEYLHENLPDSAKKSIILNSLQKEKLNKTLQSNVYLLLKILCSDHYKLVPKDELLNFVRYCCTLFRGSYLNVKVIYSYSVLIQNDNSYYDEKICEQLVHNITHNINTSSEKLYAIKHLISTGYINYDLINFIVNYLLNVHVPTLPTNQVFNAAICLAEISYHEEGSEAQNIKNILESYNMDESKLEFSKLCHWCERLTFLGCDTRNLLTSIFKTTEKFSKTVVQDHDILSLHHMAKAYFSDGYEPLDNEALQKCVKSKAQLLNQEFFPEVNLNEYFESEDYVLRSCTTSDHHFLDFVAVFGPDKKPISLSSYKVSGELFNIENIEKPPGSQIIVFQKYHAPQPVRFFNVPVMSGTAKMFLKTFESLSCSVVLLPKQFFISSSEYKKNYLTSQINEILEKKNLK